MVILLIPFINPPTEQEKTSVPPGNVIVELFWDNDRDVDIDLWYDNKNKWVKMKFVKDGSEIDYILEQYDSK